tara:strand:- start:103 stop:810 length:708 start_codon:yes stop_codon:yes gene_type:complete
MKLLFGLLIAGNIAICQVNNIIYSEKLNGEVYSVITEIIRNDMVRDTAFWIKETNDTILYQVGAKVFKDNSIAEVYIKFPNQLGTSGYNVNFFKDSMIIIPQNGFFMDSIKSYKIETMNHKKIISIQGEFNLYLLESILLKLDTIKNISQNLNNRKKISFKNHDRNEVFKFRFDKMNNLKSIIKKVNGKVVRREKIKIYEKDKYGNWTKKYHVINDQRCFFEYIRTIKYLGTVLN